MTGFYHAWLFAVVFWLGLSLGSVGLLMIYHLTGGRWGLAICRILEAAMAPLPWMALLFVPVLFGLGRLYPWANEALVSADPILQHRQPWMNESAFVIRNVVYFLCWLGLATALRRWSLQGDRFPDDDSSMRKLRRLSGGGLVVFAIVTTMAFLDWILSLEPHWYSTIFMALQVVGQLLTALCLALVVLPRLSRSGPLADLATPEIHRQLGNLLLAFVMLWTYLIVSQLVIIWMGNLPHDIGWYLHRVEGAWPWVLGAIALLHFVAPFFVLLSREAKNRASVLAGLAATVLAGHLLYDAWLILPAERSGGFPWLALVTAPAVGLVWCAGFRFALKRAPLLPSQPSGFRS